MKKILLVDDDKEIHALVTSYFPKEECRLVLAHDGLEGLQKCRNEDFDYVIVDDKMPKLDGLKFYLQFRDLQEKKKADPTPVIFIAEALDELKTRGVKFEKCDFLSKPFTKDELIQKMLRTNVKVENKIVLNPGEILFREGEEADCMYYVVKGLLGSSRVSPEGKVNQIGTIGPNELLGEMAIIIKDKRVLTITAIERSELIAIPSEKVMAIVNEQPKWIKMMLENLSRRLRDTVKQIS
jgi:two-component system chemotaxis response regulator CheY